MATSFGASTGCPGRCGAVLMGQDAEQSEQSEKISTMMADGD